MVVVRSTRLTGLIAASLIGCGGGSSSDGGDTSAATEASADPDGSGPSSSSAGPGSGSATTADTVDTGGSEGPGDAALFDRLLTTDVTVPEGVLEGDQSWRVWTLASLGVAPVFTVPLSTCGTLVGYTSTGGATITARAVRLDPDEGLVDVLALGVGLELRGLAAEPDDHFGALLWDPAMQRIHVARFDPTGAQLWSTELTNPDNTPTDFGIGDSRLEFGGDSYGAYYHVHSDSGHEGDTLKWVSKSGTESTQWGWGCSHSMSEVLRWSPGAGGFLSACVTDCYPGTTGDFATASIGGIYLDAATKVLDVDAGCNGSVAGELGSGSPTPSGWNLVFNAHQAPASGGTSSYDPSSMDQDIGLVTVDAAHLPGPVVWLTTTPEIDEDDPSIARWQPSDDDTEQYVVGWHTATGHSLARIDAAGAFLEGPVDATGLAAWGRRDDPFRAHVQGDVVWSWFDAPGSTTLHVARLQSGAACE